MSPQTFIRRLALAGLAAVTIFSSCKKDNNEPDTNEEEIITTLRVALRDTATGVTTTFRFYDLDGDGGTQPTIDTIRLLPGHYYEANLTLLDESVTPAADVTSEIDEERNEHQLFFTSPSSSLRVTYDPADFDTNTPPKPVGLKTLWFAGSNQRTGVRIVLKHQPGIKPNLPGTEGNPDLGDTDIDVTFSVVVN